MWKSPKGGIPRMMGPGTLDVYVSCCGCGKPDGASNPDHLVGDVPCWEAMGGKDLG